MENTGELLHPEGFRFFSPNETIEVNKGAFESDKKIIRDIGVLAFEADRGHDEWHAGDKAIVLDKNGDIIEDALEIEERRNDIYEGAIYFTQLRSDKDLLVRMKLSSGRILRSVVSPDKQTSDESVAGTRWWRFEGDEDSGEYLLYVTPDPKVLSNLQFYFEGTIPEPSLSQ